MRDIAEVLACDGSCFLCRESTDAADRKISLAPFSIAVFQDVGDDAARHHTDAEALQFTVPGEGLTSGTRLQGIDDALCQLRHTWFRAIGAEGTRKNRGTRAEPDESKSEPIRSIQRNLAVANSCVSL